MLQGANVFTLTYRLASDEDFEPVYDLYMDKISNRFLTYDLMGKADFKRVFDEMLATKTLFVVFMGNEMVASYRLILKTHRQAGTVYLGGFVIKDSYRGKGFAIQILRHIKKESKRNGIKRIELTVNVDNEAAIGLYKKFGFETEGITKMSYRLNSTSEYYDEYLMALIL
jgi:L-phenylalanine/L-methionine N-acetyltransferase